MPPKFERRVANSMPSSGLNLFLRIRGTVKKGLWHLLITSSSSHFFNKTDLEQYLFKTARSKFMRNHNNQRWSRVHKAQGQGHKKNPRPRPRTALPRTDPLGPRTEMFEAKAKDTSASALQKKKVFRKTF